ncbi:DUF3800 domain-containing protein [Leucobacter denitrificans]|uniref:DUF3800 domain-containing protein n=1 Tax=Leucobacter denitrificans TaxID=683042 RepID=A0A7G9S3F6_9MICO|nr:DUF3800 domain-containing protein [Leucobacter denitrificans]QNN62381.1 DUF3800 domain-containing protein [Leucobacter denitrificans]
MRSRKTHVYTEGGSSSSADHAPTPEGGLGSPSAFQQIPDGMLIAYLDEFGHVGPYIGTNHKKFFHNPVFGYAGILVPAENVRRFGGNCFYSGVVMPLGTTTMTGQTPAELTSRVLIDVVKRLCLYAERNGRNLTVLLDQGGPMPREDAITRMASFIYSAKEPEMKRIIEVPMQLESHRYGAMQFADWLCAITSRTVHYHFTDSNEFDWAPNAFKNIVRNWATTESRIFVPETHSSVRTRSLIHPLKWVDSNFNSQLRTPGATLQQCVGDALSPRAEL